MDPRAKDEGSDSEPILNEGPLLKQWIWFLTVFAFVFLALRVYCKIWRRRTLWIDDYILILSFVALFTSTVMLTVGVGYGIGLHYDDMRPTYLPITAMLSYGAGFCAMVSGAWSKTSFAVTLLRITEGKMRWFVWFIIVTVNVTIAVSATIMWITCWPVEKLWYPEVEGRCWEKSVGEKYQNFAAAYSGAMDIVLALLPWKIVWTAKIYKREKVGALLAMSVGVFSGVITFLKTLVLPEISDDDSTTVNLKIYGTAEPAATIIAASIPVLRAFIRRRYSRSQPLIPVSISTDPSFTSPRSPKPAVKSYYTDDSTTITSPTYKPTHKSFGTDDSTLASPTSPRVAMRPSYMTDSSIYSTSTWTRTEARPSFTDTSTLVSPSSPYAPDRTYRNFSNPAHLWS
jgi:hypothetical protein